MFPRSKVSPPSTPAEAKKALLAAAVVMNHPVLVVDNLALYNTRGDVPDGDHLLQIGTAAIAKEGNPTEPCVVGCGDRGLMLAAGWRRRESQASST